MILLLPMAGQLGKYTVVCYIRTILMERGRERRERERERREEGRRTVEEERKIYK